MPAAFSVKMAPASDVQQSAEVRLSNDLGPMLERVRRRLEVQFASIRLVDGDLLGLDCSAGAPCPPLEHEMVFSGKALAMQMPFVVPDTALDDRFSGDPLVRSNPKVRFYAGIPLVMASGQTVGLLSLFDTHPRSVPAARRLAAVASEVMSNIARRPQAQTIACLEAKLEAQSRLIREQAEALAHSRKVFDRAAATAKIGVWECDLATEALTWTDGVYDIFEFPRGSPIDRQQTLACYSEESRRVLEKLRGRAVDQGMDFTMDAEITTAKGNKRWMRLTTTVETENGVAVRIFGMKQDITEEKILADRTRYLAEFDVMTGLANRGQFQSRLAEPVDGTSRTPIGALLLVDLDGFKQINDTYGHALGDECLKETALRLGQICNRAELVARVGGDEFAVLLGTPVDCQAIEALAADIVAILGLPVNRDGQSLALGASVGIARGELATPVDLFKQADIALYAAKAAGRNTFRFFDRSAEQSPAA